ncbi:hypothetical protein PHYSODRAFT_340907 [Phytophthora sojae]|uniref:Uncharacterized protein n=1 Tax=Phytophthora sojae (strain P6497) TaxID=1094619 RepID=G5ABG7_PHYSP|nr:hypothetical protein PHYSODRAFT_340907 [Phytophthora sojae]EGZ06692.1 hypothetical protein PHYSODRAFT_340907 [Phytophthora sojae]|eukprot:XP_009537456.1 hypothetical protein PHYSODRAFT_340907 [Phytophthora sojae]
MPRAPNALDEAQAAALRAPPAAPRSSAGGSGSSAPPPEVSAFSLEGSAVQFPPLLRQASVAAQAPGVPGASPSPTLVAAGAGGASGERQDSVEVDAVRVPVDSGLSEPSMSSPRERSSPTPTKPLEGGRGVSARSEEGAPSSPPQSPSSVQSDDLVDPVSGPTQFCRSTYTEAHEPAPPEPSSSAPGDDAESSPRAPIPWSLEAALEGLIEANVTRTVRRSESQLEYHLDQRLADLGQLMIGLVRFPLLRVDYDLDQRLADARSLSYVVRAASPDALPRPLGWGEELDALRQESVKVIDHLKAQVSKRDSSLTSRHAVIKKDRQSFREGLSRYSDTLKKFHAYLQQSNDQRFILANLDLGDDSLLPPVLKEFLRDFAVMDFELSAATAPLKRPRETSEPAAVHPSPKAKTQDQTSPNSDRDEDFGDVGLFSEGSDDDGPLVPSSKRRKKLVGSTPATAAPSTIPRKPAPSNLKSRLGRPSKPPVKRSTSVLRRPAGSRPLRLPAASTTSAEQATASSWTLASSAAISELGTEASVPRPLVAPSSPHRSDASTSSLPGSRRLSDKARGAEDVVNSSVLNYDSPYEASVVMQSRKDGQPVRSASTMASLQSKVAVESENARDDVVLATPTAASSRGGSRRNPKKVSAKGAKIQLRQRSRARALPVAPDVPASRPRVGPVQPRAGLVPVRQTTAQARRAEASSRQAASTARRDQVLRRGNYDGSLLSPPFASPGAEVGWREILETRTVPPVPTSAQVECSVEGIQAFSDWTNPDHPFWRFIESLPAEPCLFDVTDFLPDVPISICATGVALLTKLWRQFCCRAVGSTESHDLSFALNERAHWVSPAARNARSDRLRIQIKRWWAQLLPDADGKFDYTPEIGLRRSLKLMATSLGVTAGLPSTHPYNTKFVPCNPGAMLFIPRGFTLQEVASAVIVSPMLDRSEVSAPWIREYTHYHGVPAPAEKHKSVLSSGDEDNQTGGSVEESTSPSGLQRPAAGCGHLQVLAHAASASKP